MLIDTHIHLDDKQYDADREEVIARFFASGGEALINIGAGLGSSKRSVELAKSHEKIFAAIGLHPHYFNEYKEKSFDRIEEFKALAGNKKVVAIGEIGLDYHSHTDEPISDKQKELQKKGFEYQLNLAKELNLPVIVHCRGTRTEAGNKSRETSEAYNDTLEILENYLQHNRGSTSIMEVEPPRVVFHGYGGNLKFTQKILNNKNIIFSFNGSVTYAKPKAEIFEVIRKIPLEKIMVETDGPYLTPVPFRGKRNDPLHVRYVIEKIAEIKEKTPQEVEKTTAENAKIFLEFDFSDKLRDNK